MNTTVPKTCSIKVENIPTELTELDQWAAWQWEQRGGKWTKPPLNPSGRYARTNDPDTWGSFEAALKRMRRDNLPGIGFMFHPKDGFAGVDLDGCRNLESEEIEPWAAQIVAELDSYTEVSPSRTGLKVFVRGVLPSGSRRKGRIEMYDATRFFTTTGHRLPKAPPSVLERQDELAALHRRVFGSSEGRSGAKVGSKASTGLSLNDEELIYRARHAANGAKFSRLWAGDTSEYRTGGNEGRSEADLALCSLLAFWCGPDEARIDRLFRLSGLMRKKWDDCHYADGRTYGQVTIEKACRRQEFWGGDGLCTLRQGKVYARRKAVIFLG